MDNRYLKIPTIIISLLLGFGAASFFPFKNASYNAGWNAAKARLQSIGLGGVPANTEVKLIRGTVSELKGNTISVRIVPIEPLADANLDIRLVTVDTNTRFFVPVKKDPAVYQKELNSFYILKNKTASAVAPSLYSLRKISFADVRVGSNAVVIAGKNIRNEKSFTALDVVVKNI